MRRWLILIVVVVNIAGCSDIIEVEDISNKSVTILAPVNEAILNTNTINFSWEVLQDAETYQLQIASPSFEHALQIVVDSTLEGSHLSAILEANSYEWRIRAKNSGYETPYTKQSFTIE